MNFKLSFSLKFACIRHCARTFLHILFILTITLWNNCYTHFMCDETEVQGLHAALPTPFKISFCLLSVSVLQYVDNYLRPMHWYCCWGYHPTIYYQKALLMPSPCEIRIFRSTECWVPPIRWFLACPGQFRQAFQNHCPQLHNTCFMRTRFHFFYQKDFCF